MFRHSHPSLNMMEPHDFASGLQVGAVVVGFDRHINYFKIQYATLCITENPGCLFIATNTDARTHLTDAQEWAGNGSMVGAIKGAAFIVWRTPDMYIIYKTKPNVVHAFGNSGRQLLELLPCLQLVLYLVGV